MVKGKKRKLSDSGNALDTLSSNNEANTTSTHPPKRQKTRRELFVRGLAPTATTENLVSHFSEAFPVKHGVAVNNPQTGQCKGYGFVTFADADDAAQAVTQFQNSVLLGRKIKLDVAEPRHRDVDDTLPLEVATAAGKHKSVPAPEAVAAKERRKAELEARRMDKRPPKLIVRNLPWSVKTEKDLEKLFLSFGKVKQVVLPKKGAGILRGFGFVTLRGKKNAENAINSINGTEVDGRTVAVDWAVDKDIWEGQKEDAVRTKDYIDDAGEDTNSTKANERDNAESSVTKDDESVDDSDIESIDDELSQELGSDSEAETDASEEANLNVESSQTFARQNNSTTLFIRNLPFTATDEQLYEQFSPFGPLRYARVVVDPSTERPRGTGFVSFQRVDDTKSCLRDAPRRKSESVNSLAGPSILQNDESDPSGRYTLDGRVLEVARAVDKTEAVRLAKIGKSARDMQSKDRRRLYLLNEGTIDSQSPLYESLSQTEREIREASYKQRKTLIQNNPTLHLSLTRLSVRNIPRTITSKDLKELARDAVVGFAKDVKAGKREKLSKEELLRGADAMAEAEKERKRKARGIVKQAKIVFESNEGTKVEEKEGKQGGRSRGYGFIEYYTHRTALMGLRWLNGYAVGYKAQENKNWKKASRAEDSDRRKRLIAEFAIDNAQVVHRRKDRENKTRSHREMPRPTETKRKNEKIRDHDDVEKSNDVIRVNQREDDRKQNQMEKQKKRQLVIARKRAQRRGKSAT